MRTSENRLFDVGQDKARIGSALAQGQRLVACLCAAWCSSCTAWRDRFAGLAAEFPEECFVWIDIEDHSDLVADIEVEMLPVLLVQSEAGLGFLGPIEPRAPVVRALLQRPRSEAVGPGDPDLRTDLLTH